MPRYAYDRLSYESAALLGAESSRHFGHAATTLVFEAGPLARPGGGVDFEAIRSAIESRLHLVPVYRRKLRRIPFENHPVWVDDREFSLDYHLRHTGLAQPGEMAQVQKVVARLQAQRLDRSRPLWECWLLEGLSGGRFALVVKQHAVLAEFPGDLMQVLLSPDPNEVFEPGVQLGVIVASRLSVAVTAKDTVAPSADVASTGATTGAVTTGATPSSTTTWNTAVALTLPAASVALQLTGVVPTANVVPEVGEQTLVTSPLTASTPIGE